VLGFDSAVRFFMYTYDEEPKDTCSIARGKLRIHAKKGAQFAAGRNRLNSFLIFKRALFVMIGQPPARFHAKKIRRTGGAACSEVAPYFSRDAGTSSSRRGPKVKHGWLNNKHTRPYNGVRYSSNCNGNFLSLQKTRCVTASYSETNEATILIPAMFRQSWHGY
jgi:hypothetical protein